MKLRATFPLLTVVALTFFAFARTCISQEKPLTVGDWITISADLNGGYRKTQFTTPDFNTGVFQWDTRAELWLPPFREQRRFGPYVRLAGIVGTQPDSWQNAWLGGPGLGVQAYPLKGILGPTRAFVEYNFTHYWGKTFRGKVPSGDPKTRFVPASIIGRP